MTEFLRIRSEVNAGGEAAPARSDAWRAASRAAFVLKRSKARAEAEMILRARSDANFRHNFHAHGTDFVVVGWDKYKSDVRVRLKPVWGGTVNPQRGVRGVITERSSASRRRLCFTVANTETPIQGMIVLTWRIAPDDGREVKRQLGDLFDAVRRRWGKAIEWLWWLEFQARGAPHVHVLTSGSIHDELGTRTVRRTKRGAVKVREVYTGEPVDWIGDKWLRIIRDDSDAAARFTRGGIWEKFREPDSAARYCAKEGFKTFQVQVPPQFQNVGAWWHRSRGFKKPRPVESVTGDVDALRAATGAEKIFPVLFGKARGSTQADR